MISPKRSRFLWKIFPFGFISFTYGFIYSLIERGLLGDSDYYPSTGVPYEFTSSLLVASIGSGVFGLLIGIIEVGFLSRYFKRRSFALKLLIKTVIYLLIMISFLLLISIINNMVNTGYGINDAVLWNNIGNFFFNWVFWSIQIYIASLVVVALLYSEFNDYLGKEVVRNFFTGKYHNPIEEERIFMFLDMRSSTTIAEQMGHVRYFEMLREYYHDLSDAILQKSGLIYQYVGDEVVVSWNLEDGLKDNNCLTCFELMKKSLEDRRTNYESNYGLLPTFKAGVHCGKVTTGEIGKIKKDITFTGDVLNTTARIQGLCNQHGVDLLLSGSFYEKLSPEIKSNYRSLGMAELKGKDRKVELFCEQ